MWFDIRYHLLVIFLTSGPEFSSDYLSSHTCAFLDDWVQDLQEVLCYMFIQIYF